MTESTIKDANFWQILTEIERILQTEITFEPIGEDKTPPIQSKAIVIRKFLANQVKDGVAQSIETLPGILVCPNRVMRPPEAGTNVQDDVTYRVILQFIDKDYDPQCGNLRTHMKWFEQAAKLLNHWFASHQVANPNDCIRDGVATSFDVADPKEFVRHKNFIGGVVVDVFVYEQRGAT